MFFWNNATYLHWTSFITGCIHLNFHSKCMQSKWEALLPSPADTFLPGETWAGSCRWDGHAALLCIRESPGGEDPSSHQRKHRAPGMMLAHAGWSWGASALGAGNGWCWGHAAGAQGTNCWWGLAMLHRILGWCFLSTHLSSWQMCSGHCDLIENISECRCPAKATPIAVNHKALSSPMVNNNKWFF